MRQNENNESNTQKRDVTEDKLNKLIRILDSRKKKSKSEQPEIVYDKSV